MWLEHHFNAYVAVFVIDAITGVAVVFNPLLFIGETNPGITGKTMSKRYRTNVLLMSVKIPA